MRISYSTAKLWQDGHREKVYQILRGEPVEYGLDQERAFAYGKGLHHAFEMEANTTHRLPAVFQTTPLLEQVEIVASELKLYKKLPVPGDHYLVGVLDAVGIVNWDGNFIVMIIDYKSGKDQPLRQMGVYHYLVDGGVTADGYNWWDNNIGNVPPTHGVFMGFVDGVPQNRLIHLTKPKDKQEDIVPEGTTWTMGRDFICSTVEDISRELEL